METACLDSNGGLLLEKSLKSNSEQTAISDGSNGCFDCNICLESAIDPVVTLCGHLYCWPCIYKWLQVQSSADESDPQQTCPVCKGDISYTSLVPLYGRGTSFSDSEANQHQMDLGIPRRPPSYGLNAMLTSTNASTSHPDQQLHPNYFQSQPPPFHYQHYFPRLYRGFVVNGSPYLGGLAMTSFFNPMIGMFGDMVFTRIFRSSYANMFPYSYANYSYPDNGSGSPTMRRQQMQIHKSLSRVFIFILCCIILCLLLF